MQITPLPRRIHERHGRAMGSRLHLLVVTDRAGGSGDALLDRAQARVAQLEARWSRFRPDSELSRLNAADGLPVVVSLDTLALVEGLRSAWELTEGTFDPTVLDAVVAAGYDAPWPDVHTPTALDGVPTAGCWGWELHHQRDRDGCGLVQLPAGVHLDPGGLGKGLAADLVADDLLDAGATGALVSLGGDLRVAGEPPDGERWAIDVEDPDDPSRPIARVHLAAGGVATSTSARRRWTTAGGAEAHHLIDPRTGLPARGRWRQVTAVAGTAAWAEVAAKAAFLDGDRPDQLGAALAVDAEGRLAVLGSDHWFELPVAAPAA